MRVPCPLLAVWASPKAAVLARVQLLSHSRPMAMVDGTKKLPELAVVLFFVEDGVTS